MEKQNLIHGRTCIYNVTYHVIWCVKYRQIILLNQIELRFKEILYAIAADKNFKIVVLETMPDHVHVFISAHPKISPSYMVKMMKGISARKLFIEFPEIKQLLRKHKLWNSSFYIETIGSVSEENIIRYIEKQKTRG
jgi:putative transposase